jgi:DNA gyrase subunit A
LPHPPADEEPPELYLTLTTRGGRIKRIALDDFVSAASRGAVTAMGVEGDDQLAWVVETSGQDELLLATRQGKAIRFSESDVRPMGLSAAGVLAVKLGRNDAVVGMAAVRDNDYLIVFTEKGYAKRTAVRNFPVQKRYGGGVQATRLSSRTGPVAVVILASEDQTVVLMTAKGRVTRLQTKAIRSLGRTASGFKSPQGAEEVYVDLAKHGSPVLLTGLAGPKAAARKARAKAAES